MENSYRKYKYERNDRDWMFLGEIAISILVFIVAATVLLAIFTKAKAKNDDAKDIHYSTEVLADIDNMSKDCKSLSDLRNNIEREYKTEVIKESNSESDFKVLLKENNYIRVKALDAENGMSISLKFYNSSIKVKNGLIDELEIVVPYRV